MSPLVDLLLWQQMPIVGTGVDLCEVDRIKKAITSSHGARLLERVFTPREIAYATPLWHGVDLMRHLTLGTATLGLSLVHVAYLGLWATVGLLLAQRTFTRKLVI